MKAGRYEVRCMTQDAGQPHRKLLARAERIALDEVTWSFEQGAWVSAHEGEEPFFVLRCSRHGIGLVSLKELQPGVDGRQSKVRVVTVVCT